MFPCEGRDTRRLAEVYARFASVGKTEEFLATVREKMGTGDTGAFTSDVWGAVESFLLSLQESPFMGSDYSATLEQVAAAQLQEQVQGVDLTADLEPHLDAVLVGLALHDAAAWGPRSQERLEQRIDQADPVALLDLAEELDGDEPTLLGTRPDLTERLFHRCSRQVRALEDEQRTQLIRFAQRHEAALLGPVFRALLLEEQIAVRRCLVDVVAAFSPAATPWVVSRLRSSPCMQTQAVNNLEFCVFGRHIIPSIKTTTPATTSWMLLIKPETSWSRLYAPTRQKAEQPAAEQIPRLQTDPGVRSP